MAKRLSQEMPLLQVVWVRYVGHFAIACVILAPRLGTVFRTQFLGLQVVRSVLLFGASIMLFTAFTQMDLAAATAVMNLNPVLLTLGAALLLGERLGLRRIVGIVVALIGALIVIQPGSEVFSLYALLPLGAATCYAGYGLATRRVGARESLWTSFIYTALIGSGAASVLVIPVWAPIPTSALAPIAVMAYAAALGQLLVIRAFTLAEASAIAPFGYAGVVYATVWGIALFGEWPPVTTWIGALVIVAAGLYVWHRETQRREIA